MMFTGFVRNGVNMRKEHVVRNLFLTMQRFDMRILVPDLQEYGDFYGVYNFCQKWSIK